ncbi:beta-lactamase family protein [Aggregatimonas sangjinii]|uniref:Beta-lactamase n=1 Tax=Aggregatimonas sangjinii TaxID=2583587 RepID=A0A5B7SKV8_9FLAO|nr:serine hydrolase domain-containing protein [Aggregatimonas sangjinii]QCW99175.1 beta-lactamase family protein [Aggregatimonas sangjinii]
MKRYFILFLLLIIVGYSNAQTEVATDAQSPKQFGITRVEADSIFDKVKKLPKESQIAIALIKNGETRFYGIHRKNDSIFSIDNHEKVFEIGSISKVFTSTMLAQFVLEDKVKLTDAINDYLPISFKDDQRVTFQSLANHTSGLPRLPTNLVLDFIHRNNPYAEYDEIKLKTYLKDTMNLAEGIAPGQFEYSNLGAGLLGYTLSQIEKTDYQTLLQNRITNKYGMEHTTADRSEVGALLVPGRNGGTIVPNWDLAILVGAGGIVSSTEDLTKFALAQFDSANAEMVLTRTKTADMKEDTGVGLGWFIYKTDTGQTLHTHDGGTGGYTASMIIDCENKNGVIVLSNVSALGLGTDKINKLSGSLLRTLGDYK